jgi:hypothetical protein
MLEMVIGTAERRTSVAGDARPWDPASGSGSGLYTPQKAPAVDAPSMDPQTIKR